MQELKEKSLISPCLKAGGLRKTLINNSVTISSFKIANLFNLNHRKIVKHIVMMNCTDDAHRRHFILNRNYNRHGKTILSYGVTLGGFLMLGQYLNHGLSNYPLCCSMRTLFNNMVGRGEKEV